jgi:methyl coenzyme M reductase beta subunit
MAAEVVQLVHTLDDDLDDDVNVVVDRKQVLVAVVAVDLALAVEAFVQLSLVTIEEIQQLVIDKRLFDPLDIMDDHFSYHLNLSYTSFYFYY